MAMAAHITPRMRAALAAKAVLLLALAAVFSILASVTFDAERFFMTRAAAAVLCAPLSAFLFVNATRGVLDAMLGRAREVEGAVALASRRSGYSLQLPDGRFAELVLGLQPLVAGRRYTVLIGRWSNVVVAPPRPE
jgi:hypothetical protein